MGLLPQGGSSVAGTNIGIGEFEGWILNQKIAGCI